MEIDLLGLLEGNLRTLTRDAPDQQPRVYGVVVAVVTSVDDRQQLGRVRVRFSFGGRTESAWARIAAPWAGPKKRGAYFVPEVDDEVLVAFADGHLGHPYVLGFLWSQSAPPPEGSPKTGHTVLRTARGHTIEFNDTKGVIALRTNGGCRVVLDDSSNNIEIGVPRAKGIDDEHDNATFRLDGSTGNVSIDSNGDISIKGTNISINATGTLKLNSP
jgi:uncharacterized protein involved in type VI secretion and phage assembly